MVRGTDPRIRICTNISQIHNTAIKTGSETLKGAFWSEASGRGGKEKEGNEETGKQRKREEEEEGRNFVVLTSGLSALLLGEERVGGLQPRQEAAQALHLR